MSSHELGEVAEKAHHPFERRAAASMAIIAALLAMVSVTAQVESKEELLSQQKASDQWSYYQAKSIRRYMSEVGKDMLAASGAEDRAKRYEANVERYTKEGEEIQEKARELETESSLKGRKALRLEFGEVFLEIAIVMCSLAILTRRGIFWWTGLAGAAAGVCIAATMFLVH